MDAGVALQLLQWASDTLPGPMLMVLFVVLFWKVRHGNGKPARESIRTEVRSILGEEEEEKSLKDFRDMVAHELRVVAPERHRELMQAFDDVMTRLDGLERRDRTA